MGKSDNRAKGKARQAAGALTGNTALKQEGERDERKAKVEGVVEGVKKAATDGKAAIVDAVK